MVQYFAHFTFKRVFLSDFLLMIGFLSNLQIEQELGRRIKKRRLERNLSQAEVAKRSGLSRRTVTAIENGEGSTLATLVALLRALNALDTLEDFLPDPGISPMAQLRLQEEPRKYASKPRKAKTPQTPWKWGDEK